MLDGTADFDAMLAEVGVPFTLRYQGVEQDGYGILDVRDVDEVSPGLGGFAGKEFVLTVRGSRWRGLVEGSPVEVREGANVGDYLIVGTRQFDSGDAVRVLLKRV